MSQNTPKTPEVVQAQIATFAAERVSDYEDSRYIFNNLGNLALGEVGDAIRVTASAEYQRGRDGASSSWIPQGTGRAVAAGAEYTDFLRSVGGLGYEPVQGRAEMMKEYSRFEPTIRTLRAKLTDPTTRKQHPSFLGNGSRAMVFSIIEDNKAYAVRILNNSGNSPEAIDSHLAGAVLGKGIPHLEQIVAASYEDGVTVAEVMPGREVSHLTVNEIRGITDKQLEELVDTLAAASEYGIEIDPKPSNIFYDPIEGFGIVDYHSSKVARNNSRDQDFGTIVGSMAVGIDNAGVYGKSYVSQKTREDYAQDIEFKKANLRVLERYRRVVEAKLSGEEQITALAEIDKHIASGKEAVDNYSNPQWVAERIAKEHEWKRQQAERAKKPTTDGWTALDIM